MRGSPALVIFMKLPLVTRIMIGGSDFLTSWFGIIFVILLVIGAILLVRWAKSPAGSNKLKVWSLRMPVFGSPFLR